MRVFFPFAYYYPEQCAGIYIVDDVMKALSANGVSSLMNVPTPTRNVSSDTKWQRDEDIYGGSIHIHRFPMYQEGKNPKLRALRYFFCECKQFHYLLWKKYDVIFVDSTPPIQGLKLPLIKLLRRKKVIYNIHDLFPDSLVGAGLAKKGGLLWIIGSRISRITFRSADMIIAISEDIKSNLITKGVPEEKIEVIYNWVDADSVKPVEKAENPLFEEFGLDREKFTVVYAGNLGNAQNIGIILDAAAQLPEIQFAVFGTGGLEEEVRARVRAGGLSNVHLNPLQPYERVSQVYSLGDACIVSCKAGLGGSAMPSKTWSIMSCGRPVIASFDEGELKDIIEKNECGVFSHASNLQEFVEVIKILAANPARCEELGKNARKFILNNLTKEVGTKKYVDVIKSFEKKES